MNIILQSIYVSVGILAIVAISTFTICQCFQWALNIYQEFKTPYLKYYYTRTFSDLSIAFYERKEVAYIFKRLSEMQLRDTGIDSWKFRDEVDKEFGRIIK